MIFSVRVYGKEKLPGIYKPIGAQCSSYKFKLNHLLYDIIFEGIFESIRRGPKREIPVPVLNLNF